MEKKVVSGMMLTLLLIGMLSLAFNIQTVKAELKTIYVDDDNTAGPWDGTPEYPYQNITSALEHASVNGTIFVYNGTYYENVVVNKTVSIVGENRMNTIIDGGGTGPVVNVTTDDVIINGFTIRNGGNTYGVSFYHSSNNTLSHNNITNSHHGISLARAPNNTIYGNMITVSSLPWPGFGIYMEEAVNNTIVGNAISNIGNGVGIFYSNGNNITANIITIATVGLGMYRSSSNIVSGNIIGNTKHDGIVLETFSNGNIISGNTITFAKGWGIADGIDVTYAYNNIIVDNTIANNDRGIALTYDSGNNTIYHNNFINNTGHTDIYYGKTNIWDDGYPSGGNYWSDYKERYPDANELDNSGIWDTPYVIDENNQDNYPLMNPWTPRPPTENITATVDINPDTLNLKSEGKWITVHIELPEGYDISDVNRTTIMLNVTIPVDPFWVFNPLKSVIGDFDEDGIPDLMVKFNRAEVLELISNASSLPNGKFTYVTFTITGQLNDETPFEGTDIIRIVSPHNKHTLHKHRLVQV